MKEAVDVVVIGGGAAGCFAAIQAGTHFPEARIVILERGIKPLAKVKISGGGRCNVTNIVSDPVDLSTNYPRGERFLRKAFYAFSSSHMIQWLSDRGIELREYPDGCLFPVTNDSQTIIDCFLSELKKLRIPLRLESRVDAIQQTDNGWEVTTPSGSITCKSVVLTVGGQPKISGFQLLKSVDLKIIPPIPSLFTFNMPNEPIRKLMGVVTENASVRIIGEKWSTSGPLLITHWG
ncbi:MAG: aminoacetone oxidase family FAD-binding enzyme, partial [Flavobacteriia bacterium]|nr:aminoacetone oxidase family FAD-binding enzyme [Flavobacteriia bacterium]